MQDTAFTINFHFQKSITLKSRKNLKSFLAMQLKQSGKSGAEVNFVFCSDDELLEINKKHLNHDYYTDIITFDLSEMNSKHLLADIYISADRVKENAKHNGGLVNTELHRVVFHGILHLIGYKDKKKDDALMMRNMEETWLDEYIHSI